MKLVWAKLISMGVMCKIVSQYSGHVASPILRKTFFGGWERNYGMIEGQVFKISEGMNVSASKKIAGFHFRKYRSFRCASEWHCWLNE